MKAGGGQISQALGWVLRLPSAYQRETGRTIYLWAFLAIFAAAVQVVFRRRLDPGEFATLNTVLAAVALTVVPIAAMRQALTFFPGGGSAQRMAIFREACVPLVQNLALAWTLICLPIFFAGFSLLHLPRSSIEVLGLLNVPVVLGAAVCATIYEQEGWLGAWGRLLALASIIRLVAAITFANSEPFAEFGLLAGIAAGLVLLTPIMRQARFVIGWQKMCAALVDREFRRYFAATLSVLGGIFLFTNADRIAAQVWFGSSTDNNLGYVRWSLFDGYQTAGLLGRSLLWGSQPLLGVLLARRAARSRSERADFILHGVYLGTLVAGAAALLLFKVPLAQLFGGADPEATVHYLPGFAVTMIPLGMLQGLGFFALASRRFVECFTIGASGIAYATLLVFAGKPQLMQSCMFGGGTAALLIVLFLAVVRWGRAQP